MNFVEPKVEIITETDLYKRIEIGARTCWRSEEKISEGSAEKMVKALIRRGHMSPLEHSNIVLSTPMRTDYEYMNVLIDLYERGTGLPSYLRRDNETAFISGNYRAWLNFFGHFKDAGLFYGILKDAPEFASVMPTDDNHTFPDVAFINPYNPFLPDRHSIITARFICDRGVTHELVRHRCLSFCVDGDTVIYSNSATTKHWTVKQLYEWQNDTQLKSRIKLMNIRSCDESTGELVSNKIEKIIKTGVKECFRVTTRHGRELVCTADHQILTPDGYRKLSDLSPGDYVMSNGLPLLENPEWIYNYYIKENHTRKETAEKIGCCEATLYKAFIRYGIRKPWSDRPNRHPGHGRKGMFSPESIEKLRLMHSGENNPCYKSNPEDLTENGSHIRSRKLVTDKSCCVCGSTEHLEVHHVDHNPYNNSLDNLEVLCSKHHHQRHGVTSHEAAFSDPIIGIDPVGEREVYDIVMSAPYHNFVANGIVVHNCQESTRYVTYGDNNFAFIQPHWWKDSTDMESAENVIESAAFEAKRVYMTLLNEYGFKPQDARAVLPNMLKTEIVTTGTVEQWKKYVLPLRLSKAAHPDIRRLMELFCAELGWDPEEFR